MPALPRFERFFIDHNSRNAERIAERLEQIRKAVPATTDEAVIASCSAAVVAWAGILRQVVIAITSYDEKIDILAREHPDYALMNSFPGAGPALTPRLIAALGSQRDSIPNSLRDSVLQRDRPCRR